MNKVIIMNAVKTAAVGGALAAALTGCCLFGQNNCCDTCGKSAGECCCRKDCKHKTSGVNVGMSMGVGTDGIHAGTSGNIGSHGASAGVGMH